MDYLSLYLKDGRITFQFSVNGTDPVKIVTSSAFNNNKWVKVKVTRNKNEGHDLIIFFLLFLWFDFLSFIYHQEIHLNFEDKPNKLKIVKFDAL